MEVFTERISLGNISETTKNYLNNNTLLFDIECTGLSPKNSFIYLIGCVFREIDSLVYLQLFANGYEDEKELLIKFNNLLNDYDCIMGFNSTRFDEPFLMERFKKYSIETKISSKQHIDLYLTSTKTKVLLDLPNYKQKSLECFFDLYREDKYNGGELIPIYHQYCDTKDEVKKQLLLLHNLEDVKGMVHILDIFKYIELFDAKYSNPNITIDGDSLQFTFNISVDLPKQISKTRDYGLYLVKENKVSLSLKAINDTLFTYLNDYKNYYYLINENMIVPKVIGNSIDKSLKRNATKKDCAISQSAVFIQMPEGIKFNDNIRIFKKNYDSKEIYLNSKDINTEILTKVFFFMLKH